MTSSGLSTSGIVVPGAPGCLPGLRPAARRDERRSGLRYGGSEDGGRDEVDESTPSRRSNSAIRSTCALTWADKASTCADVAVICPVNASISTAWVLITSRRPVFVFRSRAMSCASAEDDGSDTQQ